LNLDHTASQIAAFVKQNHQQSLFSYGGFTNSHTRCNEVVK